MCFIVGTVRGKCEGRKFQLNSKQEHRAYDSKQENRAYHSKQENRAYYSKQENRAYHSKQEHTCSVQCEQKVNPNNFLFVGPFFFGGGGEITNPETIS